MTDLIDRLGSVLADRYTVEREVGRGGMATVFLALDLRHERKVAVKVLHPQIAATLGTDRFLREIQIAARLEHPHVLTLIDSGDAGGLPYYVMPYVEGESLRERLKREGQLPIGEALQIAAEVADGLDYAHRQGVIHRDIKPGNILLSEGHALVTDFGVARAIGMASEGDATATGLAVGTPKYMSPEQSTGTAEIDARADVYALGCVLWEMLAGEPPFDGPTPHVILARKAVEEAPPLRSWRKTVPEAVQEALSRALATSPADRHRSAADFRAVLQGAAAGVGELPRAARRPRGIHPRIKSVAVASAAAAVVVVAGVLLLGRLPRRGDVVPSAGRIVVLPFAAAGAAEDGLSGSEVALILSEELDGFAGFRLVPHSMVAAAVRAACDSPDGIECAREVAEGLGADHMVVGQVLHTPDGVRLSAAVQSAGADGLEASPAAVSGPLAEWPRLANELAGALMLELAPVGEGDHIVREAPRTTASPGALRAFFEAEQHLWLEDFAAARDAYREAIQLDSAFALAWYRLALAANWTGDWVLAREASETAALHRARLSERHQSLVEGLRLLLHGEGEAARRAFSGVTLRYPDDAEAHFGLGWTNQFLIASRGQPGSHEAVFHFRRVTELQPRHTLARYHLVGLLGIEGEWEELDSLISLPDYVDGGTRVVGRFLLDVARRDTAAAGLALAAIDSLGERQLATRHAFEVGAYQGVLPLLEFARQADAEWWFHWPLGYAQLAFGQVRAADSVLTALAALGRRPAALRRVWIHTLPFVVAEPARLERLRDEVLNWTPENLIASYPREGWFYQEAALTRIRLYLLGLLSERLGDADAAIGYAVDLEELEDGSLRFLSAADLAHGVRAQVNRGQNRAIEALAELEAAEFRSDYLVGYADPFFGYWRETLLRAELLWEVGRREDALPWYQYTVPRVFPAESYLRRAEIHQDLGDVDRALSYYRLFERLWDEADPELRDRVSQVRGEIARLEAVRVD